MRGWLSRNEAVSDEHRLDIFRQVYLDGRQARQRVFRFALLMGFASVLATAGILLDSTAVVIGAMLVAPLITPMMGMALGLVLGWPSRLRRASTLVAAGTAIAIGTGWLIPVLFPIAVEVQANTQIVSRTTPTLLDLLVAVAAGAAGSYALSRPDISSSLPGVAIAIALVPPLGVVGITLHEQQWEEAKGASLLFATNLVAILITGGIVFLLTGVAPVARFNEAQSRLRVAGWSVLALAVGIVVALAGNGASITRDSLAVERARQVTLDWLGEDTDFELVSVTVTGSQVDVVLAGPGNPPSPDLLLTGLTDLVGDQTSVDLQWIPRQRVLLRAD